MEKFGFIGAGKMAGAIVHGMIASVNPADISCVCGNDDTGKILSQQTGIKLATNRNKARKLNKRFIGKFYYGSACM